MAQQHQQHVPFWKSPPLRYDQERIVKLDLKNNRTVEQQLQYPSNFIKTSKYNIITFFPFSLLGQFRRYANIYFLFIAIIQSIPIISPLNPASAIAPLIFVLGLSMLREGMEDVARHRSDNEVNAMACTAFVNNQPKKQEYSLNHIYLTRSSWAEIKVGDLLLIKQDEMFPADLVVLGSSIDTGACYIETSSLDGEKNLKPRSALIETQNLFKQVNGNYSEVQLKARPPTPSLGDYEGSIQIKQISLDKALNSKQLLLRGAFLRNTEWILGAVIYTGEDTKIMRNAEPGRIKQSSIELTMNKLILGILMLQIALCTLSAILASYWINTQGINHWYVMSGSLSPTSQSVLLFFSYFLLYNTMIPISLIVSMEFVKVFQCFFIEKDEEMYVSARNKYARAQTSTINEELGQIEYIFSDKTGTLTCNQMEFKYCIVGNVLYGKNEDKNDQKTGHNVNGQLVEVNLDENEFEPKTDLKSDGKPAAFQHSIFTFKDNTLMGIIQNSSDPSIKEASRTQLNYQVSSLDGRAKMLLKTQKDLIHEYFFLLCSAHECIVQKDKETGKIMYQGPSPDEITLVDAAMNMGFQFQGASASGQEFTIIGNPKKVILLNSFEFDSTRKRMSVIIKDGEHYKLFIKGADNIIKARLNTKIPQPFLEYITGQLDEFSKIGLRTLLMAMKILSEDEYKAFDKKVQSFSNSSKREEELNKLTDELERDLYLLGATAVEDKLQFQVPETIADLLQANIKIWMLTGDKLETAENIARSCRLIQGDMTVMRFSEDNKESLKLKIEDNKATYQLCIKEKRKKSFLVEGATLALIIENEDIRKDFVRMAQNCESVVCCRVTPKQKAQVVKLIKDSLNKITLAIGDGANDVNMIQEAHIGIGLYGNEGMRAVQSSDFALGEFRCLWRLVLVHGHWSYIRISEMILYFFYKNMIFTIPQFFFAFYSAYSGQTFFDDWYITFYNLFFTALPLIARASFDQDVNYRARTNPHYDGERLEFLKKQEQYLKRKFPQLYYIGQQKTIFTVPNFVFWLCQGFIHGLIIYFICLGCFDYEVLTANGMPGGLSAISIIEYTAIIFIVDLKIALYTKFWTIFNFLSLILLSLGIYIIYFFISNFIRGTYTENTPVALLSVADFYLIIILLCAIVFLFDMTVNQIIRELWATDIDRMHNFKNHIHNLIYHHHLKHNHTGKGNHLLQQIEQEQLKKRELGLPRQWGDSFFEDIVEDKHNKEKEENELNNIKPKKGKIQVDDEQQIIPMN